MYNVKDFLIMDNKQKYVVTHKTIYNNQYYYLIINFSNSDEWLVVKEDSGKLIEELNMKTAVSVMSNFNI